MCGACRAPLLPNSLDGIGYLGYNNRTHMQVCGGVFAHVVVVDDRVCRAITTSI
jgi:hypothetical protein